MLQGQVIWIFFLFEDKAKVKTGKMIVSKWSDLCQTWTICLFMHVLFVMQRFKTSICSSHKIWAINRILNELHPISVTTDSKHQRVLLMIGSRLTSRGHLYSTTIWLESRRFSYKGAFCTQHKNEYRKNEKVGCPWKLANVDALPQASARSNLNRLKN